MIRRALGFAWLCCGLFPQSARAQQGASAFLPAQHWAHDALRELDARNAIGPAFLDAGSHTTTVLNAVAAFERAVSDSTVSASIRARAGSYLALLRAEYGEAEQAHNAYALRSGPEYNYHDGRVGAGDGYEEWDWTGAMPRPDVRAGNARLALAARGGALAFSADGTVGSDSELRELQAVARLWAVQLWAGRRSTRLGPASNGIVLGGAVAFNGAGLALAQPVRFPSFFRGLGKLNIEGFVARMDSVGRVNDPWFLGARLAYSPHPRFIVGINRGAIFGGENNASITPAKILRMLIGLYNGSASEFENQIISFDMRYRVPRVPLVLFYEWGMDDGAGAWKDVPGITAGITLPLEAGGAGLDFTVEHTKFAASCCGNPIWYRHGQFRGSWADDGVLIGHRLGGEGSETAGTVGIATPGGALRGQVRGYIRERGPENVFSPDRAGRSKGGALEIAYRATTALELELGANGEDGNGWTETQFVLGAHLRLLHHK
ncbi:MAG: capsule assembly Wzi family protein [Gemmatimonadota bacterium]